MSRFIVNQSSDVQEIGVGPMLIYSVLYYDKSKFYEDNTAVIQFRARFNLSTAETWYCISRNSNGQIQVSKTYPESAYLINEGCHLHTFLAKCKTIPQMASFSLTSLNAIRKPVALPFKEPVKENLPVVSCVGSIFFAEKWQPIVTSIEIYYAMGINKQIYYFVNGLEGIYELLLEYEKLKIIDLHPWAVPEIDEYNSKVMLYGRDQIGSTNDCYQLYREAADFIIVHDVDDIILTTNPLGYYSEFLRIWQNRPLTAYITYPSFPANMVAPSTLSLLNFTDLFDQVKIGSKQFIGKSVYNTSLVQSVWVHSTHFYDSQLSPIQIPEEHGILMHARNWMIDLSKVKTSSIYSLRRLHSLYSNISPLIPKEKISKITSNFEAHMRTFGNNTLVKNLTSTDYYYAAIDQCVQKYSGEKGIKGECRTPYICSIKPIFNLRCVETRRNFKKHMLEDNFFVYVPEIDSTPYIVHSGCRV